jgi:hypothetical protein
MSLSLCIYKHPKLFYLRFSFLTYLVFFYSHYSRAFREGRNRMARVTLIDISWLKLASIDFWATLFNVAVALLLVKLPNTKEATKFRPPIKDGDRIQVISSKYYCFFILSFSHRYLKVLDRQTSTVSVLQ